MGAHERNGAALLQNAECGLDPFGHTRALEGPFSDPKIRAPSTKSSWGQSISGSGNRGRILPRQILFVKCALYSGPVADLGGGPFPKMWPPLNRVGAEFIGVTRMNGPILLQNVAQKPPAGYLGAHERNCAVLLQNAAPTPLGTHEHSRVHFLILRSGLPLLNRVGTEFIGATRKERPCFVAERGLHRRCFAAECAPDPFWHTRALEGPFSDPKIRAPSTESSWGPVYWSHTNRTAVFCCRTWP